MEVKKLWVRIQPKQASQKFYRCGMEFTREWPQEPVEADKATSERLEQEQMLEVTYTDPHADLNKTEPEGFGSTSPADQASGASVTGVSDTPNNHDELNTDAVFPQGTGDGDGGNVTGTDSDKSAEPKGDAVPLDESERYAAITAAMLKLDPANTHLWTVQGLPKTESLSAITGFAVSAGERDAVWPVVLAGKGSE